MGRVSSAWPSPRPAATRLKCQPMKSNKATVKVMTPKADRAQVDQSIAPLVKQILERLGEDTDRKSTRLNSSHLVISYAVFCLKKKKQNNEVRHCNSVKQEIHHSGSESHRH